MNGELRGIFPEVMFRIGPIEVRDTVVTTWIALVILAALAAYTSRRLKLYPSTWQGFVEVGVIAVLDLLRDMIGEGARKYIPLIGTLAVFLVFVNSIGILPGLEAPSRDINTPLALAIIVFFSVHYYGVRSWGFWRYLRQFARPIFILLPLNILTQITRAVSLAVRLFGNMLSGQFIVAILALLAPLILPVPVMLYGLFVGLLQAFIFVILAIAYIGGGIRRAQPTEGEARG